ncbi:MAG: hypothetical protein E6K53_04920 [Gammaproteobacteria bacterium]|nr:MAG: hypothetical protein E6K53_04920 [Gammaproteobacteria bacterium]
MAARKIAADQRDAIEFADAGRDIAAQSGRAQVAIPGKRRQIKRQLGLAQGQRGRLGRLPAQKQAVETDRVAAFVAIVAAVLVIRIVRLGGLAGDGEMPLRRRIELHAKSSTRPDAIESIVRAGDTVDAFRTQQAIAEP